MAHPRPLGNKKYASPFPFPFPTHVPYLYTNTSSKVMRKTSHTPPLGQQTPESLSALSDAASAAQQRDYVALHLGIQIYEMEQGVYLVDFKCSGYETPDGKLLEEKEVMSPFPFLDMAARLIMQLAEAD